MRYSLFLLNCLFCFIYLHAQPPASQTFYTGSAASYIVKAGYTATALVEVWAAGGGAGGGINTGGARTGGGGGSFASANLTLPAGSYNVAVGSGGATGSGGNISTFWNNLSTDGGNAGNSGTTVGTGGLLGSTTSPDIKRAGGNGGTNAGSATANTGNGGGGGGASGSSTTTGPNGTNGTAGIAGAGGLGGAGGTAGSGSGNGGNGGDDGQSGNIGVFPGGGGGGKGDLGAASGAGANGLVIVTIISVVPVTIISFDATKTNKNTLISWHTATEDPNDQFEIYRSADQNNWEKINSKTAIGSGSHVYNFTDTKPINGRNFYRLKVIQASGNSFFTSIKLVNFVSLYDVINVFPNPAQNELHIKTTKNIGQRKFYLIDNTGKICKMDYINNGITEKIVDISSYAPGKYTIVLFEADLNVAATINNFIILR